MKPQMRREELCALDRRPLSPRLSHTVKVNRGDRAGGRLLARIGRRVEERVEGRVSAAAVGNPRARVKSDITRREDVPRAEFDAAARADPYGPRVW